MKNINLNAKSLPESATLFAAWWQANHVRKIAVFGCGSDFHNLCSAVPGLKKKLLCLIDENNAPGTIPVAKALALCPDVVVVASLVYQESMREKLRSAGYEDEILLLYKNHPDIGALGLLAHDVKKDWPAHYGSSQQKKPNAGRTTPEHRKNIRKILLIAPPFDKVNHRHKKTMPIGLLYLASSIRATFPEISIKLIDAHIERLNWSDMRARIDNENFDLLFVSYWSAQSKNAYILSDYVKTTSNALVVHGGVHATLCPEEALKHCDLLIPYEGEKTVIQLLKDITGNRIPDKPRYLSASARRINLPEPSFIENLDSLSFPAWDLLPDVKLYDHPMHVVGGRRFPIIGSRGCPFNCTFCSSPLFWKRKVRWRSPSNVVDEMDIIAKRFGVEKFHFWDDNMVMNRSWMKGLCEELIRRDVNYQWVGLSRASDIVKQQKLLKKIKQAGCVGMEIGVESFTDQVSIAVDKGETTVSTQKAAECLLSAGIVPLYTHMLFTPGETIRSYRKKEEFLQQLDSGVGTNVRSDSTLGQLTTPHVKTAFAKHAGELGTVLWRNPSDSHHHRVNFIPKTLLADIPIRVTKKMPDPLKFLAVMTQSMYEWTKPDMRSYITLSSDIWKKIDAKTTVRDLGEKISDKPGMTTEKAVKFAALAIAGWARTGAVRGKSK